MRRFALWSQVLGCVAAALVAVQQCVGVVGNVFP